MKLYTEKQVREALDNEDFAHIANMVIAQMRPIELPSDDEIVNDFDMGYEKYYIFTEGAKWMRDKIINTK